MRIALVGLAAIAWVSTASAAEDAGTPENGLGPYHFGMSVADAEATSQRAAWRVNEASGDSQVLSGGPRLQVGASRFAAAFVFKESSLRFIVLNGQSPSNCMQAVQTLLQSDLEPTFGAFNSAPGPAERGGLISASMTAGGSEIRDRTDENDAHTIFASHRGAMFIEVQGEPPSNATQGCRVSLTFNAQTPYAGPLLTPVTYQELDSAQSLVSPRWIARPSAQSFDRYYPLHARDGNVDGRAALDCLVNADGSLRCLVGEETPAGGGFGDAALHIAQDFRVLEDQAGVSAVGKRIRVPITFRIAGPSHGGVRGVH